MIVLESSTTAIRAGIAGDDFHITFPPVVGQPFSSDSGTKQKYERDLLFVPCAHE